MQKRLKWNLAAASAAAATTMLVGAAPTWAQAGAPTVTVNGQAVAFTGQGPISQDGRTLVPLRGVLEKLGAFVQYNGASKVVTAVKGATTITLPLGQPDATVNGKTVRLDVPAKALNGSTMVPLRFVAENLDAQVNFNVGTNTIAIVTGTGTGGGTTGGGTVTPPAGDTIVTAGRVISVNAANRTIVLRLTADGGGFKKGERQTFTFATGAAVERRDAAGKRTRVAIDTILARDPVRIRARASDKTITGLQIFPSGGGTGGGGGTVVTGTTLKGVFLQADELTNNRGYLLRMVGGQSVEAPKDVTVLYGGNKISVDDLRSGDALTVSLNATTKAATRVVVTVEN